MATVSRPRNPLRARRSYASDHQPPPRTEPIGPSVADDAWLIESHGKPVQPPKTLGDLYNHLLPFVESIGIEIEPNSVSEDGFGLRLNGDLFWVEFENLERSIAYLEPRPNVFGDEDMARIGAVG